MRPARPTRSSPERAMISASAGPTSPPSGSRCISRLIELAHAGVGGAAIVNHLDFRKQPPRIGRAPHRIGADLEALAARTPDIVDRNAGRSTSASPGGSRVSVAPITSPGVSSLPGMSLSECIAACSSPERTALRISATKAPPLPPCGNSLLVWSGSPVRFELDDLDLEIGSGRGQAPGDFLGLGQRHDALARADPDSNCHHSRSIRRRSSYRGSSCAGR